VYIINLLDCTQGCVYNIILCVFCVNSDHFVAVVSCFWCVGFIFFSVPSQEIALEECLWS